MRILIRYLDGSLRAAMVLAVLGNRLRVALPGCEDVEELRWADRQWLNEDCHPVEIEFSPDPEAFDLIAQIEETHPAEPAIEPLVLRWQPAATAETANVN